MALESWDWLIKLAERKSFTRAAEELLVSQQTLSARLAALERELGFKIMVRVTPLKLTRAGEAFLAYAINQEQARKEMQRTVGNIAFGGSGVLKVGISNMRGRVMMPHVISQFHASLPGVRVRLIEGTNEELVNLAERGEADIVVAQFDGLHPGVDIRPLFQEEIVVALSGALLEKVCKCDQNSGLEQVKHTGLAALSNCPFLLDTVDDISGRVARNELKRAGIPAEGLVESENLMTLLALANAGLGAVFCPTNMLNCESALTQNLVRIPLSAQATYTISVATPQSEEPWLPAQMFEDVMGALYGTTTRH
jgi:DNA-binding transcriptional LysR family regulator